jgi:hypothetical protein
MHRPDTIIEIHRERVQDQTVDIFSGDKYTPGSLGAAVNNEIQIAADERD